VPQTLEEDYNVPQTLKEDAHVPQTLEEDAHVPQTLEEDAHLPLTQEELSHVPQETLKFVCFVPQIQRTQESGCWSLSKWSLEEDHLIQVEKKWRRKGSVLMHRI